jgi:hypothetical protein
MIGGMDPVLDEAAYRFVPVEPAHAPQILGGAIATFREAEGVSAIIPFILADELGFEAPEFARITLQVASDLEASGLTAAVATALAREGIACNMVAALHHDHAFVPLARADDAMRVLRGLQDG